MILRPAGALAICLSLAMVAALSWLLGAVLEDNPILGSDPVQVVFHVLTVVTASLAALILTGHALIAIGTSGGEPTSFQQAIVYVVLTFVATAVVLTYFGFNLTTILTTSAIVTAALGLALQPTLSSIIGGLTLQMNDVVRLGDGVDCGNGDLARVVSLNWRSVVARKSNGLLVVIPNTQLSDHMTQCLGKAQSLGVTTLFYAPAMVAPEQISTLVSEAVTDLAAVDSNLPVAVGPLDYDTRSGAIRYRAYYYIRDWEDCESLSCEVHSRVWYVFQRNRIPPPISPHKDEEAEASVPEVSISQIRAALAAGGSDVLGLADTEASATLLAAEGRLLLYASDERLVVPPDTEDAIFLLVRGTAVHAHEFGLDDRERGRPLLPSFRLSPEAQVRRVAARLSEDVGPYAELAVRRAALNSASLGALCREVAREIDNPARRERFLADVEPLDIERYGPGLIFHARRNAAGSLICHLALRAETEVAVLAVQPAVLVANRAAVTLVAE